MAIRIVIADDHSVVRQGLRMFLALDEELEVVGEALKVVRAASVALDPVDYDLGGERYLRSGEVLPDDVLDELRTLEEARSTTAAKERSSSPSADRPPRPTCDPPAPRSRGG